MSLLLKERCDRLQPMQIKLFTSFYLQVFDLLSTKLIKMLVYVIYTHIESQIILICGVYEIVMLPLKKMITIRNLSNLRPKSLLCLKE